MDEKIANLKKRATLARRYKMMVNLSEVYDLKIEVLKKEKELKKLRKKLDRKK